MTDYDAGFAAGIEAAKQQVIFALEETADDAETVTPEMATLAEEIVERFCALTPSAPAPIVPKVNPLVWEERRNNCWKAGPYEVCYNAGTDGMWRVRLGGRVILKRIRGRERAQAWAEDHREARILSQLDMAPVTVQEAAGILSAYEEDSFCCSYCGDTTNDTHCRSGGQHQFDKPFKAHPFSDAGAFLRALAEQEEPQ